MQQYKRILIKISGESLMGTTSNIFDIATLDIILNQIKTITKLGIKIGIVIGGGNIFRGINGDKLGLQRANADYMGMLATVMNGIALKDFLESHGVKSKIYSALPIANIVKGYNRDSMLKRMDDGNVIIFVAGTGNPFFTTDSGAALRAIEMNADILIKATKVDGVFNKDPEKCSDAIKYDKLSFDEAISHNLKVMDMSAFDLCRANNMNLIVCNIFKPTSLERIVSGKDEGTLVYTVNNLMNNVTT